LTFVDINMKICGKPDEAAVYGGPTYGLVERRSYGGPGNNRRGEASRRVVRRVKAVKRKIRRNSGSRRSGRR